MLVSRVAARVHSSLYARLSLFRSVNGCKAAFCTTVDSIGASALPGPSSGAPVRVCVVGTGPAGFYTAKYLLKENAAVHVDMIDMLPTPFGKRACTR